MRSERCREWREQLGAYTLGHLSDEERAGLKAHLEGCPECRAEADSLGSLARLLPHADPSRFGPAPVPPSGLADRVAAAIGAERRAGERRRRVRLGLALSGATAAVAAAVLAIFVISDGGGSSPEQHVAFRDLPSGVKIAATLEPHAYGTEIRMYVSGVRSGTLCRVFLRGPNGGGVPAGTFRYRWGEDSQAVLSSALDISRTVAVVVRAGPRTFTAPVGHSDSAAIDNDPEEDTT